ncbi:MAG: redoxin domain-containing protein [Phycisphaerales bacterium]
MAIREGSTAPAYILPHAPGKTVDLGSVFGNHEKVVLLFFPLAFSPVCTTEMCTMRDQWKEWEALDAKVFGVTADSPFITKKFREENEIPFPILSDYNREMSSGYGCVHGDLNGLKRVPMRAAFVIGRDRKVVYSWVSEDPKQEPPYDEVKKAVENAN